MTLRTRDLLAQGMLEHEIRAQIRRGALIRVRHGVYARTDDADTADVETAESRHLRIAGATWAGLRAAESCFSHHTAGVLHRLPVPRHLLGPVHITRPGRGGSSSKWLRLHRGAVPEAHRLAVPREIVPAGVVTSVAWTVADLARALPPIHGVAVADAAFARGVRPEQVSEVLAGTRQPGNLRAREVLRFADGRSESAGESHSRWLMAELGLPAPELQQVFRTADGSFVARVDFWWPDYGLIGEFDGEGKYRRPPTPGRTAQQAVLNEKHREEALRRIGWWVVRWDWDALDDRAAFEQLLRDGLDFAARTTRHRRASLLRATLRTPPIR
jgi:hypothetical protein